MVRPADALDGVAVAVGDALAGRAVARAGAPVLDRGLVATVAESLECPTPDALAEELQEVDLLDYCREALARRA